MAEVSESFRSEDLDFIYEYLTLFGTTTDLYRDTITYILAIFS